MAVILGHSQTKERANREPKPQPTPPRHISTLPELVMLSQEGRVFHGTVGWSTKTSPGKDTFSGVIDKDGVTFYAAGHSDGLRIGKMAGPDAFTLYILAPGGANPRAGFAEFKRVK